MREMRLDSMSPLVRLSKIEIFLICSSKYLENTTVVMMESFLIYRCRWIRKKNSRSMQSIHAKWETLGPQIELKQSVHISCASTIMCSSVVLTVSLLEKLALWCHVLTQIKKPRFLSEWNSFSSNWKVSNSVTPMSRMTVARMRNRSTIDHMLQLYCVCVSITSRNCKQEKGRSWLISLIEQYLLLESQELVWAG